jgi:hypothetical protein
MPVERRGWVIAFEIGSTGNGRNPIFNGRRQPSCGGTSRMTRECQVRICERLGVKFPGLLGHRVDSLRCEGSDAIGAKRTCRERRERVDLTKIDPEPT